MKKLLFLVLLLVTIFTNFLFASAKDNFIYKLPTDVGLVDVLDNWVDLPAASTATILASTTISTTTLVAATTSYTLATGGITDVIFPRNVTVDAYFSTGESTTTVSGTLTITGSDQFGRVKSEAITVSTNAAVGNIAWSTITQLSFSGFTISGASTDTVLSVGMSTKIGLSNNIYDTSDILKVIETGVTSITYTANATYDTIIFNDAPDATSDYYVYYQARTDKNRYKY